MAASRVVLHPYSGPVLTRPHRRAEAPHGEVRTPAFVPLATKAVVKTLEVREAAELGFDMVLGNTFHLFLTPGHELISSSAGCTSSCAGTAR